MRLAKVKGASKIAEANLTGYQLKLVNLDFIETDKDLVDRCYKVYKNLEDFKANILQSINIWAIYRFEEAIYKKYLSEKERYEDQVCGFLEYYDREVRNSMTNHTIYFYWGPWNDYEYNIIIFIDKPPLRRPYDNYPLYEREYYETKPFYGGTKEIDPPSSQLSDPPKPPPPPPPY
jgi:hypothetical protein